MAANAIAEVYRVYAVKCLDLAQKAVDSESKLALVSMAQAWLALADQAEKNSETGLVNETPEPRQHVVHQQQQPRPKTHDV